MIGRPRAKVDVDSAILVLEAGGNKGRLAGDLGVAQSTLNKYLHAAGRSDLVAPDLKRKPVHARRPAQNPPLQNEGELKNSGRKAEAAENRCFVQGKEAR